MLFILESGVIMKLIKQYVTKSDCYKAGKKISVKGLMIHSVGCSQPKASVFINTWNKAGASACVHAIIEPGGNVYQILPWNHRAWHCGGAGNNTHIGVEMTEPATIRYTSGSGWKETGNGKNTRSHVMATYKYAVELFAYLCKLYNLNPLADGVIISHSQGHSRGIASNHGDVEHIWKKYGLTMSQFRKDIKAAMKGGTSSEATPDKKPTTSEVPFKVKVSVSNLNIRKGPGTNYQTAGRKTGVGVFTILEVKSGTGSKKGWGRLKSGAGWISLDYAKKI